MRYTQGMVLFDHQAFSMQRFGGISRYIAELYTQLNKDVPESARLALQYAQNDFVPSEISGGVRPFWHRYQGRGRGKLIAFANRFNKSLTKKMLSAEKSGVFHPTYYDPYYLRWKDTHPCIITVHDMIHELFPQQVADPKTAEAKRSSILAADHIICVSESTKKDLLRLLPVEESRISVIYHGAPFTGLENGNPKLKLPHQYLLFVGTRNGYKNFQTLLQAFLQVRSSYPQLQLICAGGGIFSSAEQAHIVLTGIADCCRWIPATPDNLASLYRNALAFVFPSRYEGFGFPLLEAMAFGCPIIASNASSLPEIGGDAVCYFEPDSPQELAEKIVDVLCDSGLREKLSTLGKDRAKEFTWLKSASAHMRVYESLKQSGK